MGKDKKAEVSAAPKAQVPAVTEEFLGTLQKFNNDDFSVAVSTGDWLARLQLMTSRSKMVEGGKFPMNHYALIKDQNFQDVGETVDLLILAFRPKAISIGDQVIVVYDCESDVFKKIQDDSDTQNSGCMFGPEFLVWISQIQKFATFFMGSKSARREAQNVRALMGKPATLKSKLIEYKKYQWQSPVITPCTTPLTHMPTQAVLLEQANKFNNPPVQDIEKVDTAATSDREV